MIAAFGRLTLWSTKPTKWTFLIPIIAGAIGLPVGLFDPLLKLVLLPMNIAICVGVFGALYLFLFAHYKRSLVFFAGGVVGAALWSPISFFII
jgi:hypothetical protein